MNKKIFYLSFTCTMFFFTTWALAAEQTHCADYAKHAGLYPYYNDKWYITDIGELKTLDNTFGGRSKLIREGDSKIIITQSPIVGSNSRAEIYLNEAKKVREIRIYDSLSAKDDLATATVSIHNFDYKDGYCRPVQFADSRINGENRRIRFNRYFCAEFAKYLSDHPEASDCRCGTDKTNAEIEAIFKKYNYPKAEYSQSENVKFYAVTNDEKQDDVIPLSMARALREGLWQIKNCQNNLPKDYENISSISDLGNVQQETAPGK